jgi:hypothetical protein
LSSNIIVVIEKNERIEYNVADGEELRKLLYLLVEQEPKVFVLEMAINAMFTIGIGLPYGFVQFSKNNEPPYLIATVEESLGGIDWDEEVEFMAGGTPTPIAKRWCLPYDQVVKTITHFFQNNELPQLKWEEI